MLTYKDIYYTLEAKERKTISIFIERDGNVSILAPKSLSQTDLERVIEKKRPWIYRNIAQWKDLNASHIVREYVGGEGFFYLGKSYRLKLTKEQSEPLVLKDGYFRLRSNEVERAEQLFKNFYRNKGSIKIPQRVSLYEKKLGISPSNIRVMELQNRWASCSEKGTLNFHWKCMMPPLSILDYVVVHELVHLTYNNHTNAFWNEIEKVLPDYQERKDWLKQYGASLDI